MAQRTTIRLVPPLQQELVTLAGEMGISYNQLVNYALARFVEAQKGLAVLEERAQRGHRSTFLRALTKADRTKREPDAADRLSAGYSRQAFIAKLQQKESRATGKTVQTSRQLR
jgi:hypothetical protein